MGMYIYNYFQVQVFINTKIYKNSYEKDQI